MKLELPREPEFGAGVWYSTSASTWYPTHFHDEFELNLVLWGRASYQVASDRVELGPGSMLWLSPGREHTLLSVSDDLAMWVASFRPNIVHQVERSSGLRLSTRSCGWSACRLPVVAVQRLSTLNDVAAHHQTRSMANVHSHRLLTSALQEWQAKSNEDGFAAMNASMEPRRLHPAVERARELLREPDGNLPLETLSRRCGLDGPHLSRTFKQQLGLSMVRFRNHFSVQRFIARFGRGDEQTMLRVALDSGFGSYPQFHRAFHQVTGYAPSEHLRRVRAGIVVPTQQGTEARTDAAT